MTAKMRSGKNNVVHVRQSHQSSAFIRSARPLSGPGHVPGESGRVWRLHGLPQPVGTALPVQSAIWRWLFVSAPSEAADSGALGNEGSGRLGFAAGTFKSFYGVTVSPQSVLFFADFGVRVWFSLASMAYTHSFEPIENSPGLSATLWLIDPVLLSGSPHLHSTPRTPRANTVPANNFFQLCCLLGQRARLRSPVAR
jgi:hypothetical protein